MIKNKNIYTKKKPQEKNEEVFDFLKSEIHYFAFCKKKKKTV
jgi:hypothetical protein